MLFTLLTFPLHCTLDIDQSGRGRLFIRPFANEAIKSVLPWLSKGAKRTTQIICSLSKQHYFSHPAVRMHNIIVAAARPLWSCRASATLHSWRTHTKEKQPHQDEAGSHWMHQ